VAQQVKDPASSLLWLESLLWCGLNPCPQNFCMPWARPKKRKILLCFPNLFYCFSQFNCYKREISCIHCQRVSLNFVLWQLSGQRKVSEWLDLACKAMEDETGQEVMKK